MHPTHEEPETPITPSAQLPANQQPTSQPSQDAGPIKDVKRQEEFKYKCIHTGCLKYFKSPAALKAHSVRHTGEKRFFCSLEGCDKSYTTNNRLKVHLRSHTGEKPYVCDHPGCTYATVQKCNLTLHQECHLDSAAKAAIQRARMPTVPCKFCRRLVRLSLYFVLALFFSSYLNSSSVCWRLISILGESTIVPLRWGWSKLHMYNLLE
ncbi:hypothetical protein BC830DRAFT_1071171 [Chytriomyces sp. MP71]|nr:hypothetical protein BC830DRAFT_1071171 [Chytriomyces sp. MP71]